jgi:hypothetical protein
LSKKEVEERLASHVLLRSVGVVLLLLLLLLGRVWVRSVSANARFARDG